MCKNDFSVFPSLKSPAVEMKETMIDSSVLFADTTNKAGDTVKNGQQPKEGRKQSEQKERVQKTKSRNRQVNW